ncbi:unnamed protein product [Ambrosiozyma monospora]|uniref:Unnamed protein product n=1 Tax=Ambrosiozyma monospora TaxID=43982 RepID=A0A9W6YR10_AMBMO|nr:unnamed protein product [Ambrosiozyma monospora]
MASEQTIYDPKDNLVLYLINHPEIKPHWEEYTHHEFVKQVVAETLPVENFNYYIDQDYYYLQKYLYVHEKLLKLTDNPVLLNYSNKITELILAEQKERTDGLHGAGDGIEGYKVTKKESEIEINDACRDYTTYMTDSVDHPVASGSGNPNFFRSFLHLSACLFGYNPACANLYNPARGYDPASRSQIHQNKVPKDWVVPNVENGVYKEWLEFYVTEKTIEFLRQGHECLELAYKLDDGEVKLHEIVEIFKQGVILENRFWSACLPKK